MKIFKGIFKIFKVIIGILMFLMSLIGLWFLFNGGLEAFGLYIGEHGFINFIKDFFVSIWEGIRNIFGI